MKNLSLKPDNKIGICALCLKGQKLCRSHIIPEFAYKSIYDERHKMIAFTPANIDAPWMEQKGFRDRLLCSDCEGLLSKAYEGPYKCFWFDQKIPECRPNQDVAELNVSDYAVFKLFHLSVLWRASVCRHAVFANVNLGPHNERIRQMLLRGDPGSEEEYPIVCSVVLNEAEVAHNVIAAPLRLKYEGHHGYLFTFAGCQWFYFVTSHKHDGILRMTLKTDGTLPVFRRDIARVFRSHIAVSRGVRCPG